MIFWETVKQALGPLFAFDLEKTAQVFLKQVDFLKEMNKIMLVEAANATLYGWKVANHLEPEKGIFLEEDKANTKALREAEGFVRRDNKEYNARRRNFWKRGGFRGRGFFNYKRGGFLPYPVSRTNN